MDKFFGKSFLNLHTIKWSCGRVARQRSAKPFTAVRIRSGPQKFTPHTWGFLFIKSSNKNRNNYLIRLTLPIYS